MKSIRFDKTLNKTSGFNRDYNDRDSSCPLSTSYSNYDSGLTDGCRSMADCSACADITRKPLSKSFTQLGFAKPRKVIKSSRFGLQCPTVPPFYSRRSNPVVGQCPTVPPQPQLLAKTNKTKSTSDDSGEIQLSHNTFCPDSDEEKVQKEEKRGPCKEFTNKDSCTPKTPVRSAPLLKPIKRESPECPPSPCESLETLREEADRKRKENEKKLRPPKRVNSSPKPIEKEAEPRSENACEIEKKSEKKTEKKSEKKTKKGEKVYSKKYLKMKYEIELQNYLIDKMNRELQCKTDKCRPELELCLLKQRLDKEVNKLDQMIRFAINMQRDDRLEKWGPIPISTVVEYPARRSRSCPREPTNKLKPPQTPSGISLVSGFEKLDDIMICQEKEICVDEMIQQAKQIKLQKFSQQVEQLQRKSMTDYVKCEDLFDYRPKTAEMSDADVSCQLKSLDISISRLIENVGTIKYQVKKLCDEFNSMKPMYSEYP